MKTTKITALLLAALIAVSGCNAVLPTSSETSEESKEPGRLDTAPMRAQDDFYGYVNLESLQNMELGYGETAAGSFNAVDTYALILGKIKELKASGEVFTKGSCEDLVIKAYDQYLAFNDNPELKAQAASVIEEELTKITGISALDELIDESNRLCVTYGVDALGFLTIIENPFIPEEYSFSVSQIRTLAGADIEELSKNANSATKYEKPITDVLLLVGKNKEDAEELTKSLLYKVIDIARATDIELLTGIDTVKATVFMSETEINEFLTNNDMTALQRISGIDSNPYNGWMVYDKEQLAAIDTLISEDNVEELKAMMLYAFLMDYGIYIKDNHPELQNYFPDSHEAAELMAVHAANNILSMELGEFYTKYFYTDEMDKELQRIKDDLIASYQDLISNADWLSEDGRTALLRKLNNICFITGREVIAEMEDHPELSEVFGEDYFTTKLNFVAHGTEELLKAIGTPYDKTEALMPMHVVNACYSQCNTVNITAAILSKPFFDPEANHFTNLGGIGSVVAHEIGHAFDSNLIVFDENGMYNPSWLPEEDLKALEERNEIARDYFENYFTVFKVYHVDGEQTLGENYADLGGMECITNICKSDEDYVKLFEAYATIWCELGLEDNVIKQLANDPHSPSIIRTNAILATTDDFYRVYNVQEGDGMYVAPENRISRWK